ncbi:MAG: carbamoyl-phosphate synthase large subunit [Pseudomonadota bacterium]
MVFALTTSPLAAQNPAMTPAPLAQWPGAEIVDGVAFQGDGSVSVTEGAGGLPIISFWRPILFKEETEKPVAGRMDCKLVATEEPFNARAFDPDALYAAVKETRKEQGFIDFDRLRDVGEHVKQLDVVSRRKDRRAQFVLSYILVRDGERLINIRRNCTFVYRTGVSRPDVIPYLYRYTRVSFAFEPGDGSQPESGEG